MPSCLIVQILQKWNKLNGQLHESAHQIYEELSELKKQKIAEQKAAQTQRDAVVTKEPTLAELFAKEDEAIQQRMELPTLGELLVQDRMEQL